MLILFLLSNSLFADNIKIKPNGKTSLKIVNSSYGKLQLSNSLAEISTFEVRSEKGVFAKLKATGYVKSLNLGGPELPVKRELIEIPQGAEPIINIISYNVKEYQLSDIGITNKIFPVQPPHPKNRDDVKFVYDEKAYQKNNFIQEEIVTVDVLGEMRGVRIGRVNIAPVQYNPVFNIIRVYEDIEFEIVFKNADISKTEKSKLDNYSPFFTAINSQLVNYQQIDSKENFKRYPVKYVIVSDPMFESQLQPFIEWKTKKGFTVIEAYTDDSNVGNSTASIKTYLQGLYDAGTTEDPAPSFVLFVGDVAQIPAWTGVSAGHATDLYYCEYTGDYFPEIYYGRFSAETPAQLQPQIDKTLEYEQYLMPDPSYLNEVVMVAGMDAGFGASHGNGQLNYGTINYFNEDHGITSHTYLYPESGNHSADIIQNVSDGVAFGNYTAHCGPEGWGDPSFTSSDIPGLQNASEYGLLIGNCCLSNSYNLSCFGEELLRAENKGAIGYIGGSNSTTWDEDYYFGVGVGTISEDPPAYQETTLGAYDRLFHDHGEVFSEWYVTQDEIIFAGNFAVTEGAPNSALYYWEIYCVMGDPSVMNYLSVPPALTVSYQPLLIFGVETFSVTTEPYAYVGISKDGVLHGAALANSSGIAEVPITPFTVPGDADVVVTKQNAQPYIGTVTVTSANGPYVIVDEFTIDDAQGNGNGLADFGESVLLDAAAKNAGNQTATSVSSTLSTTDTYITIIDNTHNYGDIAAAETISGDGAFAFTIADNIPDQHIITFEVEFTDNSKESWVSTINILGNAPGFTINELTIDDSGTGNGDGILDPGETADIKILTTNSGHADAPSTSATLTTENPNLTINSASYNLNTLATGTTAEAVFNVTAAATAPIGTLAYVDYSVNSGNYSNSKSLTVLIGEIPVYIMQDGTETLCLGKFYDAGGPNSTYQTDENITCTFLPATSNAMIKINFISFDTEVDYDLLYIYDGNDVNAPQITGSPFSGSTSPGEVVATNNEGAITIRFTSDYMVNAPGWAADISCNVATSVNDLSKSGELNVYPNPVASTLYISSPENSEIFLYSLLGEKVKSLKAIKGVSSIDVSDLPSGQYIIRLMSDKIVKTKKIIINN